MSEAIPMISHRKWQNTYKRWLRFIAAEPEIFTRIPFSRGQFLYFASCERDGLLKFGWSRDPAQRIPEITAAARAECKLLVVISGGGHCEEQSFCSSHRQLTVKGKEWFSLSGPVRGLTDRLRAGAEACYYVAPAELRKKRGASYPRCKGAA